jgi:formylglycine-generating enzyme required for sulfatase activity
MRENLREVGSNPRDVSGVGVHDLGGNAQEWCWDLFSELPSSTTTRVVDVVREVMPGDRLQGMVPRVQMGKIYSSDAAQPFLHRHGLPASVCNKFTGFRTAVYWPPD